MNKTKIEWTDYSWNPITGCLHGCWYCWAKRMFTRFHKSFEPTFYPERLEELKKLKKPAKVFVCSVSDLFATWTKPEWRNAVLNEIHKPEYNHLTFQLLTKNPERIPAGFESKENIWVGTTITFQGEMTNARNLIENWGGIKFLSLEPLLGNIEIPIEILKKIQWIIVGKLTGSKKVKLENWWVNNIIDSARVFNIPIFLKNNLKWSEKIQEFPK
jgi:protein gp37